jgi:hypothetical protein
MIVGLDPDAVEPAAGAGTYRGERRLRRIGVDGGDLGDAVIPSEQLVNSWVHAEALGGGRAALLATARGGVTGASDLGLTVVTPCFAGPRPTTCP